MSVESCKKFLQAIEDRPELAQAMKAVTEMPEILALGSRHGFEFTAEDMVTASTSHAGPAPAAAPAAPSSGTHFYHHEYDIGAVPALAPLLDELPALQVRPPSVDLTEFDARFRQGDLDSTSDTPASAEYQAWHRNLAQRGWRDRADGPRRDFHLVNLDEHVEHPGYAAYFAAKTRVIALLEGVFGDGVRFSGSLWYPPRSYRLWHTNETQPGWRMYIIDLDDEFPAGGATSFFRYQNPATGELVTLPERRRIARFFKAEQDPDKLFWHCIVNPTERHRWSFGFVVPQDWHDRIEAA